MMHELSKKLDQYIVNGYHKDVESIIVQWIEEKAKELRWFVWNMNDDNHRYRQAMELLGLTEKEENIPDPIFIVNHLDKIHKLEPTEAGVKMDSKEWCQHILETIFVGRDSRGMTTEYLCRKCGYEKKEFFPKMQNKEKSLRESLVELFEKRTNVGVWVLEDLADVAIEFMENENAKKGDK